MTQIFERPPLLTPVPTATNLTMVQAINRALHDSMATDDRVLVFGEDVARLGGVFRVTDGLSETFGESRCFDTPLAESGIVGIAIGLAIRGLLPVPEIQFDGFAYPAVDQIVSHLAKYRMRTRGDIELPVTIRISAGDKARQRTLSFAHARHGSLACTTTVAWDGEFKSTCAPSIFASEVSPTLAPEDFPDLATGELTHKFEIEARDFTPQRLGTRAARIHHMILKKGILYEQGSIAWGEEMLPVLDGGIAV